MIVPQQLWVPSPKDLTADMSPQSFLFRKSVAVAAAAATVALIAGPVGAGGVSGAADLASDKVLVIQHILVVATSAAGELVTAVLVNFTDDVGNNISSVLNSSNILPVAGVAAYAQHYTGNPIPWGGRGQLLASAAYSGAVQNKTLVLNVQGIVLPRGNWQFP